MNGVAVGIEPNYDFAQIHPSPTCVNSCITKALYFGDLNDPESEVSRLLRERKSFRLLEELGTDWSERTGHNGNCGDCC